jgi:glutamine synthetase
VKRADWLQILKYCVHNTAHAYGKTATFMPKPGGRRQRLGHARAPVDLEGRQESLRGRRLRGPVELALYYIGGIIKHAKALNAITNPGNEFVQAAGAGLRGADQPRLLRAQPLGRDPHSVRVQSQGTPHRSALPDPTANPYLAFSAMMMAGLDGIQNKIHPGDPMDKNLYDLEPEEAAKVPHPCASLDEALETLDKDRAFLTRGGVFTDDMIDGYIALKMEEVTRFRMTTHPVEFDMYYSL